MQNRTLQKFFQNKAAMFAAIVVLFICLLAIFAYPLCPDNSPNATRTHLQLATVAPGTSVTMLKLNKAIAPPPSSAWQRLWQGTPSPYEYVPITAWQLQRDTIFYEKFVDENSTTPSKISLKEIDATLTAQTFAKARIEKITYHLGTDKYGRDMLSRLLLGARISLAVGFIAVLLSVSIGIILGSIAGYFGGKIDAAIQWLINVIWAIPTLLLVFAITYSLGKGFWQVFIAIGLTMWIGTARLIRGQVMAIKNLDYVQAARVMGFSHMRIIFRHILPNIVGPTIVVAASNFATAILIEAGLSFLGVGVQPPTPSWGWMIKENYNFLITNKPLLAVVPGLAIMIMVLSFNIIGNGLRDAFDVKD